MKIVLVDTSAWLALINKTDLRHYEAKRIRDRLLKNQVHLLVTDYILVEIANTLSRIPFRKTAIELVLFIQSSPNIQIIEIDKNIFKKPGSYSLNGLIRNGVSPIAPVLWS